MNKFTILACALLGFSAQDPPKEPYVRQGAPVEFFKHVAGQESALQAPEARHALLILLQELKDTREFIGTPVARALASELRRLLFEDLRASTWADLSCVPGESAVIAAALRHAARFKQVSLATLWKVSQGELPEKLAKHEAERIQRHAERVMRDIVRASDKPEELKRRLADTGEAELAARIEGWK